MYDYGSPEKNKEHYGNVSVMITLLVTSIMAALILLFCIKQISLCKLLYIELSNSFLIGRKSTANFRNQRP